MITRQVFYRTANKQDERERESEEKRQDLFIEKPQFMPRCKKKYDG
jgi:hypothetical protein